MTRFSTSLNSHGRILRAGLHLPSTSTFFCDVDGFGLFNSVCKQHYKAALNSFLNGTKNCNFDGTWKQAFSYFRRSYRPLTKYIALNVSAKMGEKKKTFLANDHITMMRTSIPITPQRCVKGPSNNVFLTLFTSITVYFITSQIENCSKMRHKFFWRS